MRALPHGLPAVVRLVLVTGLMLSGAALAHQGAHQPTVQPPPAVAPLIEREAEPRAHAPLAFPAPRTTTSREAVSVPSCPGEPGPVCSCTVGVGAVPEQLRIAASGFTTLIVPSREALCRIAIGPQPALASALVVVATHGSRAPPHAR